MSAATAEAGQLPAISWQICVCRYMQSIPGSAGRMWILKSIRDILQNAPPANIRLMDNVPMKEKINCKLLQKRAAALMCCSPIFKSYVHGNGSFSFIAESSPDHSSESHQKPAAIAPAALISREFPDCVRKTAAPGCVRNISGSRSG